MTMGTFMTRTTDSPVPGSALLSPASPNFELTADGSLVQQQLQFEKGNYNQNQHRSNKQDIPNI